MLALMLHDKIGKQFIDSKLIEAFDIRENTMDQGTGYMLVGHLHQDYGTFDLLFGEFDTMIEAQEHVDALCRQSEAE